MGDVSVDKQLALQTSLKSSRYLVTVHSSDTCSSSSSTSAPDWLSTLTQHTVSYDKYHIKGEFLVLSVKWHLTVSYVTNGYR